MAGQISVFTVSHTKKVKSLIPVSLALSRSPAETAIRKTQQNESCCL